MKENKSNTTLDDLTTRTKPVRQAQKFAKARPKKSAVSADVNNPSTPQRSVSVPVRGQPPILNQVTNTTASRISPPTRSPHAIQHTSASRSKPPVTTAAPATALNTLPRSTLKSASKAYSLPTPITIGISKTGPVQRASLPSYASQPTNSTPPDVIRQHQQIGSTTTTRSRLAHPGGEPWWHSVPAMNLGVWLPPLEESKGTTAAKSPSSPAIPEIVSTIGASASGESTLGPLKTFTCFPRLPPEIRLLIWKQVYQVSRVIRIEYNRSGQCTAHHRRPPIGFHVCQESREEALKVYRLAFGSVQVFINFNVDVIFLDNGMSAIEQRLEPTACLRQLLQHASHDDIRSIRNLAVGCTQAALLIPGARGPIAQTPHSYWHSHGAYFELPKFPNLERLIFAIEIPPHSGDYRGSNSTYDRMHQYKRARIRLIFPDGFWDMWLLRAIPYVDCIRKYLRAVEMARAMEWKAPELEIASLRVW